jgi:hypothetical protein
MTEPRSSRLRGSLAYLITATAPFPESDGAPP